MDTIGRTCAIDHNLASQPDSTHDATLFGRAAFRRFLSDNRGATAIEYALVGGLIAAIIVTGVTALGTALSTKYGFIATAVSS